MATIYDHSDISNIDVDWVFRGKKRSKRRSSSSSKERPPTLGTNAASNTARSTPSTAVDTPKHPIVPATPQPAMDVPKTSQPNQAVRPATSESKSILVSQANRPRSSSDTNKPLSNPLKSTLSNVSISSASSGTSIKRTNSLNDSKQKAQPQVQAPPPKKKSLFSALSKLKTIGGSSSSSSSSAPIQIPSPKTPKSPKSIASSVDSFSPPSGSFLYNSKNNNSGSILHESVSENSDKDARVVLNKNPNRSAVPIKELSDLKMRRVTFALDKLPDDPPQQIPSRRPKKGNVIVVEDLISGPSKLSVGISNESQAQAKQYDEKELKLAIETQRRALEEANVHAQEAHYAAMRIASEVIGYQNKLNPKKDHEKEEDDEFIAKGVSDLEIDKPIHLHEHHFDEDDAEDSLDNANSNKSIPLDLIYTRCCHLREILPIPATLKQLKNKTAPLPALKLLNPKPTLIDIYSFSDFIAIVPIKTLVFDNVTMNTEMFQIILSSVIHSKSLEKLSLRNVPLDELGWKFLCKFLSRNKSLLRLDISQQKIKSDLPLNQIRAEMDWNLFTDTLILRNGIEELILNGCKIPIEFFSRLIDDALTINTKRLGVAQMDLSYEHCKRIAIWASSEKSSCEGLDIGFNDLREDRLKPFIKRLSSATSLQSISLNSTQLDNVEDAALMIRALSKLPNLRFLDLSNLKSIFTSLIPYLNKYLPRFANLNRLHLDSNELNTKSITILSEILPKCARLVHVSIMDNGGLSYPASAALYGAVKSSHTIMNFDLDYDLIDETISSRIAVCLMRNMERTFNQDDPNNIHDDTYDDIMFDGSLIAETAGKLLDKISQKDHELHTDEFGKKFLKSKFLDKIKSSRTKIDKTIGELLAKRSQGELSLQGKEDLLRFYFLDSSLEKILNIFENLNDGSTLTSSTQQQLQASSTAPITDASIPHQVALEVNGGRETPVDVATGKPILLRNLSQTSVQAKKQEEEEGEFHKWGFFVQQQNQIYPASANEPANNNLKGQNDLNSQGIAFVSKLPSGAELRDAVLKAKGESIDDLIDNVNHNRIKLDNIYNGPAQGTIEENVSSTSSDNESLKDTKGYQEVDEAYDKLLNNLSRVRSNK